MEGNLATCQASPRALVKARNSGELTSFGCAPRPTRMCLRFFLGGGPGMEIWYCDDDIPGPSNRKRKGPGRIPRALGLCPRRRQPVVLLPAPITPKEEGPETFAPGPGPPPSATYLATCTTLTRW